MEGPGRISSPLACPISNLPKKKEELNYEETLSNQQNGKEEEGRIRQRARESIYWENVLRCCQGDSRRQWALDTKESTENFLNSMEKKKEEAS